MSTGNRYLAAAPAIALGLLACLAAPPARAQDRAAEQWYAERVCLPAAHDVTAGSPDIVLAVIDDGFDLDHEDLPRAIDAAFDFSDEDGDPSAGPLDDHGTPVAGIAVAVADNGRGIAGVCPGCAFLPIRRGRSQLDDARAIVWAADSGAAVINCSWGYTEPDAAVVTAIAYAVEHGRGGLGSVVVFAAGSGGDDVDAAGDIAATAGVLAVMASDSADRLWSDSNVGHRAIAAPAGSQLTTDRTAGGYDVGPYTDHFGGSSGAAPIVAGTAGLVLSVDPSLRAADVRAALLSSADAVASDARFDDGVLRRLHAGRAVARAAGRSDEAFDAERCAMRPMPEPDVADPASCAMPSGRGGRGGGWILLGVLGSVAHQARRRRAAGQGIVAQIAYSQPR